MIPLCILFDLCNNNIRKILKNDFPQNKKMDLCCGNIFSAINNVWFSIFLGQRFLFFLYYITHKL